MLFQRKEVPAKPEPLTPERAQAIYDRLRTGKTEGDLFKDSNDSVPFPHSAIVMAEARRLEGRINLLMINAQTIGQMDDLTEQELIGSLSSSLLDVATVVTDVRNWSDGNPDEAPSWDEYKATFKQE